MARRGGPAWDGSDRRSRLPADWPARRDAVFARPGGRVCALQFEDLCVGAATEVDHVVAGDDHAEDNLQPACQPCHRHKSALEGAAAAARRRARARLPVEVHPAYR